MPPSTYRKHVAQRRDPLRLSARIQRDIALKPEIARVFAENFAVYGVRKVWRQMVREGAKVIHRRGPWRSFEAVGKFAPFLPLLDGKHEGAI